MVFAGTPNLRVAAHEATHVIQQRGGVQLTGGIGKVGDVYEQQAEAVADRVMAGQPAVDLLDRLTNAEREWQSGEHNSGGTNVDPPVQRLIGFEFETAVKLLPGATESRPQKDEKLLVGENWHLAAEVVPDKEERVAEFKTTALDDQVDASRIATIMESMEYAVWNIAMRQDTTLRSLSPYGTIQEAHKDTTARRENAIITSRPQVTGGINVGRIINLLADLGSGTESSREELLGAAVYSKEKTTNIEDYIRWTVQQVREKLSKEPPEYQSFIALLAVYIIQAQTSEAPRYFKAIIPALSRMDLGEFIKVQAVIEREKQVLTDLKRFLPDHFSEPLFPKGVYDSEKKKILPLPHPTIEEWVAGILQGHDPIPWTVNVNQKEEPFALEPTGPPKGEQTRSLGVPIEIRSLKGGVPFYDWKPLAVNLFRYIQTLNDWSKEPKAFERVAKTLTGEEKRKHEAWADFLKTLLANK